jgi:hypothetical protein
MNMFKYLISLLVMMSSHLMSEEDISINIGQEWSLESRSNKLSPSNSKVLYFMPSDAYHTYRARQFGDWDVFSIVNARNLERLNRGDVIKIVEPKFNKNIYQVTLMNGLSKNRNFYVIADDLIRYFKPIMEHEK